MCYHPNILIQDRDLINQKTGKNWQKIAFYNSRSKDFKGYEYWNDFNKDSSRNCDGKYRAVQIDCFNQCIECCEKRAKEWATKCAIESNFHKENYFITLTYDDVHLPICNEFQDSKGNMYYDDGTWNSYLEYEDAKKFIKSLRDWQRYKYGNTGIKYFGCGEYGGKEGRAHFHIIFFGLHLDPEDCKVHTIEKGTVLYECKKLEEIWDYKGFVSVGEANWQTARYVAGYVQKKQIRKGKDEYEFFSNKEAYYARRGQTQEKLFMSNHPGIGKAFYEENKDTIFVNGYIMMNGAKNQIVKAKIPRYFERMLESENESVYEIHKERKQKIAERNLNEKMSKTSLSIKEQLEVEERSKLNKMLIFNLRDKVG